MSSKVIKYLDWRLRLALRRSFTVVSLRHRTWRRGGMQAEVGEKERLWEEEAVGEAKEEERRKGGVTLVGLGCEDGSCC